MNLKVKCLDIASAGPLIVVLDKHDAFRMDLHPNDRILLRTATRKTVAIVDIALSHKTVAEGKIGVFEEVAQKLHLKQGQSITLDYAKKPESLQCIKKKLDGLELTDQEIEIIVDDIVRDELTEGELTFFVSACYTKTLSYAETVALTKSMTKHGEYMKQNKKILDKHSIGGLPGNRVTMIAIPIVAAAGFKIPKTSSRAITSATGTADTMEVLAPVTMSMGKIKHIVNKVNGCIAWGGGVNIAPADDKMIKVRKTMAIDPNGLLISSILAKKLAVGSSHVVIDMPIGPLTKVKTKQQANALKTKFESIAKLLGMKISVVFADGSQPVGSGIGPSLECRDVLWILQRSKNAPKDLEEKGVLFAAELLKLGGVKNAEKKAKEILESGKAYKKMMQIIKAQGGNPKITPEKLPLGKHKVNILAGKTGTITAIDIKRIAKLARIAGSPLDHGAGLYLLKKIGDTVTRKEPVFTVFAHSEAKLKFARTNAEEDNSYTIQ